MCFSKDKKPSGFTEVLGGNWESPERKENAGQVMSDSGDAEVRTPSAPPSTVEVGGMSYSPQGSQSPYMTSESRFSSELLNDEAMQGGYDEGRSGINGSPWSPPSQGGTKFTFKLKKKNRGLLASLRKKKR